MVARQFVKKVKVVRSDNGTEFFCLRTYFDTHGIIFETSYWYASTKWEGGT